MTKTIKEIIVGHKEMVKFLVTIFCIMLVTIYSYANDYEQQVKEISNEVVRNCKTFDERVLTLRRYVHGKMQFPKGRKKPNGEPIKPEDIYPLNTINRLNSGLGGWCDQLAVVFIHLAKKQGIATRYVELSNKERTSSPHTIVEVWDGKRWVIVDLDPTYDLELFNKEGRIASRSDIVNDFNILHNHPHWGDNDYLSMYINLPWRVIEFKGEE